MDELLKRLENVEIDGDERREIAEYIAQTFSDKGMSYLFYIMMKDKTIYDYGKYRDLLKSNKISPNDAYVFIENNPLSRYDPSSYFYPFLGQEVPVVNGISLITAYLSKLGFENEYYNIVPATGLRYLVIVSEFPNINRIAVDVADINNVVFNTHLLTLIHGVLGTKRNTKYMTYDEVKRIISQFILQKLFAGHTLTEAQDIIYEYYKNHDTSLAKEVEVIKDAYNRIFQPFRIEYDLNTKQFQVGDSNEDR
jgi:hypothetical protein